MDVMRVSRRAENLEGEKRKVLFILKMIRETWIDVVSAGLSKVDGCKSIVQ